MPHSRIEALASEFLMKTCTSGAVDGFVLADAAGLLLTPVGPYDEGFDGREIRVNSRASHREQHEFVVRCVARELLARAHAYASHATVQRLARSLLLPHERFDERQPFATLLAQHYNATAAMIGARKGDFARATASALSVLCVVLGV